MRRFTQTFVLAPQAPKKYYVHNDIFRYQDFGYADEEEESENEGNVNDNAEREVENENVRDTQEEIQQNQVQLTKNSCIEQHGQSQQPPPISQQQIYYAMTSQQQVK